jgi:hypothetical protein
MKAALTRADARYDAIFAQYGVIRVQDYDELLEVAHLLAHTPKPGVPGIAVDRFGTHNRRSALAAPTALDAPQATFGYGDRAEIKNFATTAALSVTAPSRPP